MPWLCESWHSRESHDSQNPSFPREASFPLNPSFPRKRESRDLCDRKAGIGRMALDSWSPIGVGDELSRE